MAKQTDLQMSVVSDLLFDRMPMGIAIIDRDYRILRYNPTWEDFSARYAPPEGAPLQPGVNYFDFLPGSEPTVLPLYQRVLAGETIRQEGVPLALSNGVSYWDVTLAPLIEDGEVVALLNVSVDATERVLAQQTLEQRVEERTRELSTLLRISQDVSSTLAPDALLGSVLDQLKTVLDYNGASLMALQGDALRILAYRGPIPAEEIARLQIPLSSSTINEAVIRAARPIIIEDVRDQSPLAQAFRRTAGEHLDSLFGYIRCWMGVPLKVKGQVIGMLTLDHSQPGYYAAHSASLALLFANQAAIAIENARLFQETERRRAAAESLRDIIRMINSSLPLEEFLQRAVALAARQLGAGACVLHHLDLENEVITQAASYGMEGIFEKRGSRPFSALRPSGGEGYLQALLNRQPIYGNYPPLPERVEEIRRDPTIPDAIKRERIALRERYAGSFAVPLYIQDKLYGGMVFYYTEPQEFHEEQIQLGLAFAEQVAVALENARLLAETAQRRSVAESLRETLSILNTARPLDEILQHIVAQARQLLQAQAAAVHKLDSATGVLSPQASVGLSAEYTAHIRLPLGQGALGQAVLTRQPVAVNDTTQVFRGQTVYTAEGQPVALDASLTDRLQRFPDRYGAVLAVPMSVQGEMYGGLVLYYPTPRNFQPEEIELAATFASQASLAIENALLRAQAAEGAALAERGRLARDLHDAVTQTLFSASLIAEVLPKLWERNPEMGRQKLEELRLLTRGALSEMRTLLLELRPDTLADVELADLCRHLAHAFSGRTRVPVTFTQEGQAALPPQVKETFYRVVQEALNNIAKHAAAGQVQLHLALQPTRAEVSIRDDGAGFDPTAPAPESLGLKIMRERAAAIGARLTVESQPGRGTRVAMVWNVRT